ncbi:protein furry homolog isoform X2 [Nematostella vectensis]|uniref:protein furry homolog isoform X2 n=1 Tax=Nematostella vectensis TaxID=45351 RepID=UPI002076FCC5|nr:protein furry homolog isoform X2 [Nematostella vectensis]
MEISEYPVLADEENSVGSGIEYGCVLPWGVPTDRPSSTLTTDDITAGEFVLRTLFADFTLAAEKKIETVLAEPLERPLSKSLQRGEDPQFDQLLNSLSTVAEYSLLSLLKTLFLWYEKQQNIKYGIEDQNKAKTSQARPRSGADSPRLISKTHRERDCLTERRDLAVDFLFCLVLIEILKQLHVHPVEDEYLQYIETLAFRHFKLRDVDSGSPSATNYQIIAALYAEVIGVLALARFPFIRKRFMAEFKEHQNNPTMLIHLIYGMKYLRIKLFPVEELEEGFLFMRECAALFIDAKEKEVKYALALMFVEILVPVAASANRELNVPALKNFVDMMYHQAFDMAKNRKHCQPIYPLVTILLCVSQKSFFLNNWPGFLSMCLTSLRQRDVKVQRVAMECLYRLVWVYVIRIKCESNTQTVSRLRSIIETLFPRGSRTVVPALKDVPLNIFVKVIHFIAQEKLDFAMNDIVFDLLGVGRSSRQISPERMNIGLRAFFVIADNLQRKGGEPPPMPSSMTTLPSGNTIRIKKATLPKTLTESAASNIGLANYYHSVRKALDSILRALDAQVGKPMTLSNPHVSHKEPDDMITGERKPKIDLFRTCIAAIPRCIPEGMTKTELVDLLSRLTVHMDEELRGLAFSSLQSLVLDFADWREDAVLGFVNFIMKEVQDNFPSLLDSALKMLLQLLAHWKTAASGNTDSSSKTSADTTPVLELSTHSLPSERSEDSGSVLHTIEGGALVMLCSTRPYLRKLALMVLREVRCLHHAIEPTVERKEKLVMDVIDQVFPTVLEKTLMAVPQSEKLFSGPLGTADMLIINERLSANLDREPSEQNLTLHSDFWVTLLSGLLDKSYIPRSCPSALQFSWPAVFNRLLNVYSLIDPGTSGMDSITSLSSVYGRGPKKVTNMADVRLWQNYLVFACCTHPTSHTSRSESPEQEGGVSSDAEAKGDSRPPSPCMVDSLFRFAIPLLKTDCSVIRDAVITSLGRISPISYRDFLEEIHFFAREALDRRAESLRKRRKKDSLRSHLTRVFELNAQYGIFADSESGLVSEGGLSPFFTEYIDGIRLYLEGEPDKDWPAIMHLRLYFCNFVYKMIISVTNTYSGGFLTKELRRNLFFLFSSWCAHFGVKVPDGDRTILIPSAQSNDLELASLNAMCALLQCGAMFDPNGLILGGYLYNWLETVLNSPKEKIHLLGHDTLVRILENNTTCAALLNWVIDKCYTGTKLVVSGCFKALVEVFTRHNDYPCDMIPILNVVLFKTADACIDTREKAAQLLQILERRFFQYSPPSISCSAHCSYSQSQRGLSEALATAHPEITVHMFQEMTSRFQSATFAGQRCILQYMLPWLANIELMDLANPMLSGTDHPDDLPDDEDDLDEILPPVKLEDDGWGSIEATQLVLNNLFYITVKYDELYSKEIEATWASLCSRWTNNVHEILSYLITLVGVVGHAEVLIHAKKLAVYIARAKTERTIEELMEELKLTETVASQFERCDDPPYFRIISKTSSSKDSLVEPPPSAKPAAPPNKERATRPSAEVSKKPLEEIGKRESKEKPDGTPKLISFEQATVSSEQAEAAPLAKPEEEEDGNDITTLTSDRYWPLEWALQVHRRGAPVPLPVPDTPSYYAPLADVLPFAATAASLYRCNFALMLLTELVLDQAQEDWGRHLPLMLHVIFLGLDHGKAMVYEHCKRLLINLVVLLVCHGNYITVAEPLFKFMTVSEQGLKKHGGLQKSLWTLDLGSMVRVSENFGCGAGAVGQRVNGGAEKRSGSSGVSAGTEPSDIPAAGSECSSDAGEESASEIQEQVKDLIEFLANSACKALWAFEDITSRSFKIKSTEQMEVFLALVIHIFKSCDEGLELQEKWAKVALNWATTCSSRHYAGRSFQVFRSLKVPLSWPMLSDVLARLVESVGDSSEDVQGYVMEILLTLEAATDWTMYDSADPPAGRDRSTSTSSGTSDSKDVENEELANFLSPLGASLPVGSPHFNRHSTFINDFPSMRHYRSLSSGCDVRRALGFYNHLGKLNNHSDEILLRARSASVQCLRMPCEAVSPQSQTDMITRVFWIAVSLLESDYDHEYLMAIEMLNQVLTFLNLGRIESRERLEKVLHRLKWTDFPGLQALLLKGLTNINTYDSSLRLLARLTVFSDVMIVDPSQVSGLGINILALLPYMVEHFSEPDEFSRTCAANIVQVCCRTPGLANLGKMFSMFGDKSYHRPRNTWVEVVCKYIHDSFSRHSRTYLTFLLEVLENGPSTYQESVLAILWAMMKLMDFSSPSKRVFYNDTLRIISKYIKGTYWKESLDILKFAVSKSSNLDTPPPRPASSIWSVHDSTWVIDALPTKKELPGRTLAFTFDLSATPVIGRRGTPECAEQTKENKVVNDVTCARKAHISQRRTRERLVTVLQTCGHNVGLKQSPSVVFSSSSDLAVEKPSEQQQSSDEDLSADKDDQIMSVLTKFDFLDDVSEESSDESRFAVWPGEETRRESFDTLDVQSLSKTNLPAMGSFSGSDQDLTTPHESSDDEDELNRSLNEGSLSALSMAETEPAMVFTTGEPVDDHEVVIVVSSHDSSEEKRHLSTSTESAVGTTPSAKGEYQLYSVTERYSVSDEDVDGLWADHVTSIIKDSTGVTCVNTYSLFWNLYKASRKKFYSLTRECCNYLDDRFKDISQHFCNTLEFLVVRGDCPFVCLDTRALRKARMLDRHKFITLELHDHYVNYITKRDKTVGYLDCVKLALKRSSVGSHNEEPDVRALDAMSHEQRQMELCQCLYKMHFHFLLLCNAYSRLLDSLTKGAHNAEVTDNTAKASTIRAEIATVLEHLPPSEEPLPHLAELETATVETATSQLLEKLTSKDFEQAVNLLRAAREKFGGHTFGSSDEDNLDSLVAMYCRNLVDKDMGTLVMSSPPVHFTILCSDLMDVNISTLSALKDLELLENRTEDEPD